MRRLVPVSFSIAARFRDHPVIMAALGHSGRSLRPIGIPDGFQRGFLQRALLRREARRLKCSVAPLPADADERPVPGSGNCRTCSMAGRFACLPCAEFPGGERKPPPLPSSLTYSRKVVDG